MYYGFRIIVIVALVAASYFSIRRAWGESDSNTESLLLRALKLEYDGGDATALLERAAQLNPMSSTPRIRLGLAAEIRGDNATAEKWLLDAARVDRQFEPPWTLANFYFRRENFPEFWKWLRAALEISYGDRRPVFALAWRASSDAGEIRRAIPDRVAGSYLGFLLDTGRAGVAGPVALKLASFHDAADRALLLGACDEFIRAGLADEAADLWRALFGEHRGVFAGDFETPRISHGFDWRTPEVAGVVQLDLENRSRRRISLDGRQPESCELLRQTILVEPGRRYALHWESRLNGLRVPTGIEWRIAGARGAVDAGELSFTARSRLETLTLNYDRPTGSVRAEGSVELWSVALR